MGNLKTELLDLKSRARNLKTRADAEGRGFTPEEITEINQIAAKATDLSERIDRSDRNAELLKSIGGGGPNHVELTDAGERLGGGQPLVGGEKGHLLLAGKAGKATAKSIAEQIQRAYGVKAFITGGAVTASVPLLPEGPIELGAVPVSVLDVLHTTVRDTPTYRFLKQTVATNNAAIVAPGALKPTSVVTVNSVDGALAVFAHLSEYVDEYLLRDNDALANFLAVQLLRMLQQKVEEQVIGGSGAAGNLTGLLNQSGVQVQAFAVDRLNTLRQAALKLETAGYSADVFVVSIADWAAIETARNSSGNFDLGGPIDRAAQKVWGSQVITSSRIATGTALALDLDAAGLDVGAEGIEVKWDTSTGFDRNQTRARVEGRFGLSVYQPTGIVKAAFA